MATLEKIQARVKKLQAQAEALLAKKTQAAVDQIRDIMLKHGLTTEDIGAKAKVKAKRQGKVSAGRVATVKTKVSASAKGGLPPKYRDPKTGATWSGHARPPAWIKDVKDRTRFLIAGASAPAAVNAAGKSKPSAKPASKAATKSKLPPKYRDPKTGATWSGHARPPAWIANVKDRSRFLIASSADAAPAANVGVASKAKPAVKTASAVAGAVAHKGQRKGPQPAKYRDPKTGASWSGRGPTPAWLAGAKDRSKFLIDGAGAATDVSASTETKPSAKKAVAKKAVVKKVAATKTAPTKKVAVKKVVAKKAVSAKVQAKKAPAKNAPRQSVAVPAPVAAVESGAELTT
jgi:DNA-binding protein H-NS